MKWTALISSTWLLKTTWQSCIKWVSSAYSFWWNWPLAPAHAWEITRVIDNARITQCSGWFLGSDVLKLYKVTYLHRSLIVRKGSFFCWQNVILLSVWCMTELVTPHALVLMASDARLSEDWFDAWQSCGFLLLGRAITHGGPLYQSITCTAVSKQSWNSPVNA